MFLGSFFFLFPAFFFCTGRFLGRFLFLVRPFRYRSTDLRLSLCGSTGFCQFRRRGISGLCLIPAGHAPQTVRISGQKEEPGYVSDFIEFPKRSYVRNDQEDVNLTVKFHNPLRTELSGVIRLKAPENGTVQPQQQELRLAPGQAATLDFQLKLTPDPSGSALMRKIPCSIKLGEMIGEFHMELYSVRKIKPDFQSVPDFVLNKLMTSDLGRLLFLVNKIDTIRPASRRQDVVDNIKNRIQEKIDNNAMLNGYKLIIGALCVLLALIGIANVFSNTLGFVRQRKREFARYMSIGMTPEGMRKMFCVEALVIAGRPVLITLPVTAVFVWLMIRASYLNPMEFWSAAPIVPVALFIAVLFGFVGLAYYLGGRQILKCDLVEVLQSDYM